MEKSWLSLGFDNCRLKFPCTTLFCRSLKSAFSNFHFQTTFVTEMPMKYGNIAFEEARLTERKNVFEDMVNWLLRMKR